MKTIADELTSVVSGMRRRKVEERTQSRLLGLRDRTKAKEEALEAADRLLESMLREGAVRLPFPDFERVRAAIVKATRE